MSFAGVVVYGLLLFVVVAGIGILTSRTAISRLAEMGLAPHALVQFVPVLTLAARAAAIALIAAGLAELGLAAGWFSDVWVKRYGLGVLVLVLGAALLAMTFRNVRT